MKNIRKNWTTLQTIPCMLAFFFMCGSVAAQTQDPLLPEEPISDSRYVGEVPANSGYAAEFDSKATRDDNILANNAHRIGDNLFQEGGLLDLWDAKPLWSVEFQYRPTGIFYQTNSALNALDQNLILDGEYRARPNLRFLWNESFQEIKGILESPSNEFYSLPTGPPPSLNATVLTPLARQLANQSEVNVAYDLTSRSSIDVSGSYAFANFSEFSNLGSSDLSLFNTQTGTGGLGYQYRLTRHFTIGGRYLFQYFHFGQANANDTHSMFLTVSWEMGPHATLSFFGGSQYSISHGQFVLPLTIGSSPGSSLTFGPTNEWVPAGGGSLTLRSDRTVLRVTAQRLITDGGGLLTTVINQNEGAELRQRIAYGFDFIWTGSNARSIALDETPGTGAADTQSAGMSIEHSLFEDLSMHVEYDFMRQRINSFVPFEANANINRYTVGVSYRIGDHKR
jgi:hypothetical protein